ncbi:MAG: biotin-dependent carboxyltransferase family protein [Verrucomicrobiota bacterium]
MKLAHVKSVGMGISYQDLGRRGWRRFGIPPSGAMDQASASLANQLIENPAHSTVLEIMFQGAQLEILEDSWIAISGADSCSAIPAGTALKVKAGDLLTFTMPKTGIWTYVAVAGGWLAPHAFGSTSRNARAQIGKSIAQGDFLESNPCHSRLPDAINRRISINRNHLSENELPLTFSLQPGPDYANFPQSSIDQLVSQPWLISNRSDRTGYRLEGSELEPAPAIQSEPVLEGSLQVPPDGRPIITMPDGPTVGGYPRIAWMDREQLSGLSQCQPETEVKFRWTESA